MDDLSHLGWPMDRIAEAIHHLSERAGFPSHLAPATPPPVGLEIDVGQWVEAVARWLGLEAEPVDAPGGELPSLLMRAAPALVRLPGKNLVLVIVGRGRKLELLCPSRRLHTVDVETVSAAMVAASDSSAEHFDGSLAAMGLTAREHERARHALVREHLRATRIEGCWLLRMPAGASFWRQAKVAGLPRRGGALLMAHATQVALGVGGWVLLGRGALEGRLERGWLVAWAMLLATIIPVRLLSLWLQGDLAIGFGKLLKRRLLAGALRVDPEVIRREGAGRLLARTLETTTIESLALNAALGAVLALVELVVVLVVLGAGSGGAWHVLMLVFWIGLSLLVGVQAYRRTRRWTEARRELTHGLVEHMVGHRTRLAQQDPSTLHDGADEALEHYLGLSRTMDRSDLWLQLLPYAWVVVGLLGLAPGFVAGDSNVGLAIGLGGVLLGGAAMTRLVGGLMQAVAALVSWRQVGPLFDAAAKPVVRPSPAIATADAESASATTPLLRGTGLTFHYEGRPEPALKGVDLQIDLGDRLLLEGPSGGGKSTLASVLAGLRQPTSGLLLLDGLDHPTLGDEGWRQRVAAAPQYHDNHILSETFAFNVMFSRPWPPTRDDFIEAVEICRELGLGDLLARMPAGLVQHVGETGWRLSHGERSRVFIARALFQRARLIILDESFAALDPKTLERCLQCVIKRAPSLLVVAHP